MAHQKLRLVSKIFGMENELGTVKVEILARDLWEEGSKLRTRKCPKCSATKENMKYSQLYKCDGVFGKNPETGEALPCGESYSHWSQMPEIIKATGAVVEKERLLQPKEQAKAYVYRFSASEYAKKVAATSQERGLTTDNEQAAKNLKKLLVAQQMLGYVIVLKWKDTYTEEIGILTTNEDGTVVLKQLIPDNLVEINADVLKATKDGISTEEIEEAKQFLKVLPEATAETFKVSDYRTTALPEAPTVNVKVQTLEDILKASKQRAEAAASAA